MAKKTENQKTVSPHIVIAEGEAHFCCPKCKEYIIPIEKGCEKCGLKFEWEPTLDFVKRMRSMHKTGAAAR